MSKGTCGLFSKTNGAIKTEGINPAVQKTKALNYASSIHQNGTKAEKNRINTVSVVFDEQTGKYYYGMNGGIALHNSPKNAILFGDETHKGLLPKTSLNNFPVGHCAEIDAVNKALNDGASLSNLHITTISATKKNINGNKSISKCACENCTTALKGLIKQNNTGWIGE